MQEFLSLANAFLFKSGNNLPFILRAQQLHLAGPQQADIFAEE